MTSIKTESLSEPEENIDKRSPSRQHDRFVRRLNKYRVHQSDCKMKNDSSSRELCEQESFHIEKLQRLKATQSKPKRTNKKKVKTTAPPAHQPIVDQNDLADLNYKEMLSLLAADQSRPADSSSHQTPQDLNCSCVPNAFQYFYDFHQAHYSNNPYL